MAEALSSVGRAAAWVVARSTAVVARLGFAAVEGFAAAFSRQSMALMVAAQVATFAVLAGPRAPLRVAAGTLAAVGTFRTLQLLVTQFRNPQKLEHGLQSIWDWEPPAGDASSAWHILRQLAVTVNQLKQDNPAVRDLLNRPTLAANELAMRLWFLYRAQDEPLLSPTQLAALAAAEGGSTAAAAAAAAAASGAGAGADSNADAACDLVDPVPVGLRKELAHYRALACAPYYFDEDRGLGDQLADWGYTLAAAAHTSDLATSCPAYFLAVSEERREVALVIRGTWSPEDAFFDLLATGADLDDGDGCEASSAFESGYCHSGMGRAALFLGRKLGPLLRPLHAEGLQITLVGHSLGAGVASLLAVWLHNRLPSSERLRCYAFEAPACMDLQLAQACAGYVTSTVVGDDIVPRMCIRSFAGLLEELAGFDWEAAAAAEAAAQPGGESLDVARHLSTLLLWALKGSSANGGAGGGGGDAAADGAAASSTGVAADESLSAAAGAVRAAAAAAEGAAQADDVSCGGLFDPHYNAHVPGRVVLFFRQPGSSDGGADGSGGGGGGTPEQGAVAEGESAPQQPQLGMALVDTTARVVRRMRLSPAMIADHYIDKGAVISTLGPPLFPRGVAFGDLRALLSTR